MSKFHVGQVVLVNGDKVRITSWPDDDQGIFRWEKNLPDPLGLAVITGDGYYGADEEGEPLGHSANIIATDDPDEASALSVNHDEAALAELNGQLNETSGTSEVGVSRSDGSVDQAGGTNNITTSTQFSAPVTAEVSESDEDNNSDEDSGSDEGTTGAESNTQHANISVNTVRGKGVAHEVGNNE